MTDDALPRRQKRVCNRKVRHEFLAEAQEAARNLLRKGQIVTPYKCTNCDGYHVGSMFPRRKRRR